MCQILVFNAINTIVTDIKGNIRIYKLPLGPSTDLETDISLALGSDNIISISLYHDPWAVCIIYLLTGYEGIVSLLSHETLTIERGEAEVNSQGRGDNKLAIPEYTVYKYFIIPKNIRLIVERSPQNDKDQ